ncbi:rhomboid family intramembrane serine protease [Dokdonia pacifica]|uniref:Rhomboid family protein n=1 Tax=Dokdonia pacifica TaxID=1627892 RepID=A0A239DVQ8_9FLAO|nr:rhomboid family intramembrane serine protease [Dokdonia pacifica]GGG41330.1 rhomboid family intramembrane serine protease [Dokdonia pacifica]SNS36566.1 Rhomboid family protein [Dokdonia pacifica]
MADLHPVTIAIIAINVLFSMKGFNDYSFKSKYLFQIGAIRRGEQVRMISSAFLHANPQHLFVNMLTLYFFANTVIGKLGVFQFVVVYVGSLIIGNLLSYYFHKDEYHYSALGASGAVSGILYAAILLKPDMMLGLFFVIPMPAYVFGIGYLLYSIYGMRAQNDNIGHDAHFGGAVGGYLITLFMVPTLLQTSTLMVVLLAIPIVILFVMIKLGKI